MNGAASGVQHRGFLRPLIDTIQEGGWAAMVKLVAPRRRKPRQPRERRPPGPVERFLGWCVHAYTASGLLAAGVIAVLLVKGGADAFRWSFLLMALATIVDSTDGTLARKVRIKEVVPEFDGRRLDDLVDFLNYTFLPLLLIWRAGILPNGQEAWLLFALVASAYGFCQVNIKTDDGFFLGFPSLWNVVALYLYVLPFSPWVSLGIVILLAVLTFVPTRHLYPSQPGLLNRVAMIAGVIWTPLVSWVIWMLPTGNEPHVSVATQRLAAVSFLYPIFYFGASWVVSILHWRKRAARI
jgi:phosphatidylcholine synthase